MMKSALVALLCAVGSAVDQSKFRTCEKTGFCDRTRSKFESQDYEVVKGSLNIAGAQSHALLQNSKYPQQETVALTVQILANDVARVSIREVNPKYERFEVPDVLLTSGLELSSADAVKWTNEDGQGFSASFGNYELKVTAKPFTATLLMDGKPTVLANSRNLMQYELFRDKNPKPENESEGVKQDKSPYDEDNMWEEKFSSHTDSKPRGPSAVAMDTSFPGASHVYGIPEHATSLALKNTDGSDGGYTDPYRLYNLDVFEYDLDVPMALYGAVPFLLSHDAEKTSAVFWLNAAETFIDISDLEADGGKSAHWISESGIIDMFLMTSTTPSKIFFAYSSLTGFQPLPPKFAIAYHQCRWNYKSEGDVAQVDGGFDEHDIPYDVLWLDIEHTDGKKYFTWDKSSFPSPKVMQDKIAAKGRKMVTIVDPHIKRDSNYYVHTESQDKGLYVKNKDGGDYEGWCWPGSVSYLDFFRPEVREYWTTLFALDKYEDSTPNLYVWNDMNEPSVFNGPEVTMQKDNLHLGGKFEHRDVHNMYGFYHHWATEQGLVKRDNARPFVLTRSFFAGSQKYAAVWTGDNMAKWDHLKASVPMLLALNIAGIVFSGADVGGFFGNPEAELMVRWYQVGAFQPFFRGHAHIDATRREPWLFGEPHTTHIRQAIRNRYVYLPYLYTVFHQASTTGMPIMRPLWVEFPSDKETFADEDSFLLGNAILVAPATAAGQSSVTAYFPGAGTLWYDVLSGFIHTGGRQITVKAPIGKIPVFQRGGTIVPQRQRARRSSAAMATDPYTLVVALDEQNSAMGTLYMDDDTSFDHLDGVFVHRMFRFENNVLTSSQFQQGTGTNDCTIERIIVLGKVPQFRKAVVSTSDGAKVTLELEKHDEYLVVRKPDVAVAQDWSIEFIE